MPDTMVTVSEAGVIGTHKWMPWNKINNFEKDVAINSPFVCLNIKFKKYNFAKQLRFLYYFLI